MIARTPSRSELPSEPSAANDTGTLPTREQMLARLAAVRQQFEAARSDDPSAAYQARLAQPRGKGGGQGRLRP